MKKIIFIGSIYPDDLISSMLKKQEFIDFAAHKFQYSLLSGLINNIDSVYVLSSPVKKRSIILKNLFINGFHFGFNKLGINGYCLGSINIPFLNMIYELFSIFWKLRSLLKSNSDSSVIIYALHTPFLLAVSLLSKKIKHKCIIVPDLPEFMSNSSNIIRKIAKRIDRKIIHRIIPRFDSFVLISEAMVNRLPIKNIKHINIEGIYSIDNEVNLYNNSDSFSFHYCNKKTILYSGQINACYGVFDLLKAFTLIESENYELWLCGPCSDINELHKYLKNDKRIKYLGLLNKSEVYNLQKKATVLVNPRHSCDDYTKYSFPSKTIEYLASGTPTLMCKLPSIPDEYFKYMFLFEDESILGYKKKLIEVCSIDHNILDDFGQKASNFIITQKNACIQSQKITDLIFG